MAVRKTYYFNRLLVEIRNHLHMHSLARIFLTASVGWLAFTLQAAPLRIVCLGDSITQGRGDHSGSGEKWTPTFSYRYPLWKFLVDDGVDVDFVGSLHGGFEGDPDWADYQGRKFDRDHEGHWGWKTVDVAARLPGWIQGYTPDVALILLGSNDANGKTTEEQKASVERVRAAMADIVATLRKKNPKVVILLGQCFQEWAPFPAMRAAMVEQAQAQTTTKSPVTIVDHSPGWVSDPKQPGTHTADWVHPNRSGDEKLARNWFAALKPFLTGAKSAAGGIPAAQAANAPSTCPPLTKIRLLPREGHAQRLVRARFTGSNEGQTTEFRTIAEIKEVPGDGQWTEITVAQRELYRYVKFESPSGGWGNIAEVEFYSGDQKLTGTVFGTAGSRGGSGNDFRNAMDGDATTFFDGVEPNGQYVGLDLGPAVQAHTPSFSPKAGAFEEPQTITINSATPAAQIRITRSGTPSHDTGDLYKGPIKLEQGQVLAAVAYTDALAASPVVVAAYRIGKTDPDAKLVRTFHIGNSLTDTIAGGLQPLAASAGKPMDFHRFTIPGAPTDWLWDHPGSGFGDPRYLEAFFVLAPIHHLFTQPFAGHGRSIENEAEYSGRFFAACRKHSPEVQPWLYVQWPGPKFEDNWSRGKIDKLPLKPATTWQEAVANHLAYTEAVRERINHRNESKPVLIVPGGLGLALLKTQMDAGKVPGMTDFFKEIFSDDIHLTAKGRYLIALVHYACIYKESPEGKVSALTSGLSDEQAKLFQRLAWEAARGYRWSGIK